MMRIPRRVHRRIARWLIVPIGLGLTLPQPALALRAHADTAGLEDALGRSPAAGPTPSLPAGLEEDDNFIFELARSQKPLTVEDVLRVNAWVLQPGEASITHEKYLQQLLDWVRDETLERGPPNPDRYPMLATGVELLNLQGMDFRDAVTRAAVTHLLFPRMDDGTHRTAWLIMDILLHRAGQPMISYQPTGRSDDHHHHAGRVMNDPSSFIRSIHQQVDRARATPYELIAAHVADLTRLVRSYYRMLVVKPEGLDGRPLKLFITTRPLRVIYQSTGTKHLVRQLVDRTATTIPGFATKMVALKLQQPGMRLDLASTFTILVRVPGDPDVSNLIPSRRLAIVTLTPEMTLGDALRAALAQWTSQRVETIGSIQRMILRGRRLNFYTHLTAGLEEGPSKTHLELLRSARGLRIERSADGATYGVSPDESVRVNIHGSQLLISVGRTTDAMLFVKERSARDSRTLEVSILDQYKTRVQMEGDPYPLPFTAHSPDAAAPLILDLDFDDSTPQTPRLTLTIDPRVKNLPSGVAFTVPLDVEAHTRSSSAVLVVLRQAKNAAANPVKRPAAGLEEDVFAGTLDDRPNLQEVAAGEFTVINRGQVKTLGAVICMICAIYTPERAGPALLAHLDPDAMRYPTSYKRLAMKAVECGLDVARARMVLLKDPVVPPDEVAQETATYRKVRRGVQRAFRQLGRVLQSSQVVEDQNEWGVALDADTGRLFDLRRESILDDSPVAQAAEARLNDSERRWKTGERPILRYVELQPPAPAAGLEEDDNFIFALARSSKPLTAEDVYAVNAWVTGKRAVSRRLRWPADWHTYTADQQRLAQEIQETHTRGDRQLRDVLRWLQTESARRAEPATWPTMEFQLVELREARVDLRDPVVLAAIAHWLLTPGRAEGRYDGTHRTAWLVMNILLARAGYPMIAYRPGRGRSDGYFRFDVQDNPGSWIKFVRREVAHALETRYAVIAAPITDLTESTVPYRMLVQSPDGLTAPFEVLTTTGPVRIVCEDEATARVVRQLVKQAPATGAVPGLTNDALEIEVRRPGMTLNESSRHTILVRPSTGPVVSDSTPPLPQRLAIITLTPEITTFADILQHALAQWANRPLDSIRPLQRVILRGRRLDLYA